ncbi:hypothetical protein OAO01_03725 [Oligoflexia bacterium]|nr:hypothetical protein [Oligoflexia bacterium]
MKDNPCHLRSASSMPVSLETLPSATAPSRLARFNPPYSEIGVVLPIFITSFVTLLLVAALVLDTAGALITRHEASHYARLASLKALETYFGANSCDELNDTEQEACRYTFALAAANELSESGDYTFDGIINSIAHTFDDGDVILEMGHWGQDEVSCGNTENCFVTSADTNKGVNSARISGSFTNYLTKLSSSFFGTPIIPVSVNSVAVAVPRNIVLTVDTSDSIVGDSHEPDVLLKGLTNPLYRNSENEWSNWTADDNLRSILFFYFNTRPPDVTSGHYYDDYLLKSVAGDGDVAELKTELNPDSIADAALLIGYNRLNARFDFYHTPQPFTSVFQTLNTMLNYLHDHRVAGDKISVIFYDSRFTWNRIFKLTDLEIAYPILLPFTDPTLYSSPVSEEVVNDPWAADVTGLELIIRQGLIPLRSSFTDMLSASELALEYLTEAADQAKIKTQSMIINLSDGVSNCVSCDPDTEDCSGRCSDDYDHYNTAMTELESFAVNKLVPKNITMNFFHFSAATGPHTVDHETLTDEGLPSGECLTAQAYRASEALDPFGFVRGLQEEGLDMIHSYNVKSSAYPFYEAAMRLNRVAVLTRGGLYAMREPATGCPSEGERIKCEPGKRQNKDPYCRTTGQQIAGATEELFSHFPFRIVE